MPSRFAAVRNPAFRRPCAPRPNSALPSPLLSSPIQAIHCPGPAAAKQFHSFHSRIVSTPSVARLRHRAPGQILASLCRRPASQSDTSPHRRRASPRLPMSSSRLASRILALPSPIYTILGFALAIAAHCLAMPPPVPAKHSGALPSRFTAMPSIAHASPTGADLFSRNSSLCRAIRCTGVSPLLHAKPLRRIVSSIFAAPMPLKVVRHPALASHSCFTHCACLSAPCIASAF